MATISIEVDNEVARSFFQASVDEKQHLNFLLNLRLKELMLNSNRSLTEIMDEIGCYSESQGMTPELLASLLNEK
jgi:hypothetical protein